MSSNLGTLLKEARAKTGLTQEQLAKKAGSQLTGNDISRAERGLDVPSDTQLKAIAKVTGVTQKSLLDAAKAARGGTAAAAKPAAKTTAAAKKTASKATATAKKPASTTAAKKPASTARKTDPYTLTATEKKLIDAYRSASSENKKLALALLQGKDIEQSEGFNVGSILQNGLSSGLGGVLETLISGLGK